MRTFLPFPRDFRADRPRRDEHGFATVIVLALLFVMIALILGNSRVVHSLAQELRQVEQRQLQKYGGLAVTNAAARIRPFPASPSRGPETAPENLNPR